MYKNTEHTKIIDAMTSEGSGIARIDGYTVFIPGAITGDTVRFLVVKENKKYGFGKLLEIINPSPDRVAPECATFSKCGGCTLSAMNYSAQLEFKRKKVYDAITRIGGFTDIENIDIIPSNPCYGYRNKAQFPVSEFNGEIKAGFYAPHSHRVVPTDFCALSSARSNEIVNSCVEWFNKNNTEAYNEITKKGALRHICIRSGKIETMLVFVTAKPIKNISQLASFLAEKYSEIVGVVENYNPEDTNVIYGTDDRIIFGRPYIIDTIGNLKYKIHYKSFYQVNPYTTLPLYEKALELSGVDETKTVFDLYCGGGTISLFLAQKAKSVIGIEIVEEAIINARENAGLNNIENAEFYCGAAEEVAPKLIKDGIKADVVVLDPPRKGCDEKLLKAVGEMKPERIVYVSCDCATMARDAKFLSQYGYEPAYVTAADQFPQTAHVESIALLTLSN